MSKVINSYPPPIICPAISIVIPLYNAEKYVGECLESILNQTFQNFEVVVVNDCSTDSSCKIVESYIPKFGGRLTLSHMSKNTGCGALPCNKGLNFSRGEYIFFMDADDMLTKTGLEEMYAFIKEYDADVVHCEKYYETDADGSNIRLACGQPSSVDKPTLESENLSERFKSLFQRDIWGTPWCELVRRKFLIENELYFQKVRPCYDLIWTFEIFFFAKKFLRIPNATYFFRQSENSTTRGNRTDAQNTALWLNSAIFGLKGLDSTLGKLDFFKNNFPARYSVVNFFLGKMFEIPLKYSLKIQPFVIYEELEKEFGEDLGEQDVLVSALCTYVTTLQKINALNFQKFNQFAAQAQQRIAQLEAELSKKT